MRYIKKLISVVIFSLLSLLTSCQSQTKETLKVAATSIPHAEILEQVKPIMKERGIRLEIVVVEDYNTPNRALNDREIDANFFQHYPFLEMQNREFNYSLESLAAIHLEPMALYSKRISTLSELKPGSQIAIPSDPTNQARALCLLEKLGLLKLSQHDAKTSIFHVIDNPKQLKLIEIDSPLLSRTLDDVDLAAITTNFALQAGLSPNHDALAKEDANSLFVNLLVIRPGESNRQDLNILKEELTSPLIKTFIHNRYQGAIIPVF